MQNCNSVSSTISILALMTANGFCEFIQFCKIVYCSLLQIITMSKKIAVVYSSGVIYKNGGLLPLQLAANYNV